MPIVAMFQASSLRIPTFLTTVANDHQNIVWKLPEKYANMRFILKERLVIEFFVRIYISSEKILTLTAIIITGNSTKCNGMRIMKMMKYNVVELFHNFWPTKKQDNSPGVIVKASDTYPATLSCTTQSYMGV